MAWRAQPPQLAGNHTMKDETRLVTLGRDPAAHYGTVNTPVYRTSTVLHPSLEALDAGGQPYAYGRLGTPTTAALADAIAGLHGAAGAVLTPSGLSAVSCALLSVLASGDHLIVSEGVYEPSMRFVESGLRRFGVEATVVAPDTTDLAECFRSSTRAVLCESPSSLTFEVQDMQAIAAQARARGMRVLVDNTWATPLGCKPLALGADVVIEAATKYISGHADVMAGVVAANADAWPSLRRTHRELGLCLGPDDAWLALRGLRTLAVRQQRQTASALRIADWLAAQPAIARVLCPMRPADRHHDLWKRQFQAGSGVFGVILKPVSDGALAAFLDGLGLFGMGWSWGGYESLVVRTKPQRSVAGVAAEGPLLRFSIGLEDADDLIADLHDGLARLTSAA